MERTSLLQVPVEIRLMIYDLVFQINPDDVLTFESTDISGLLFVCHQFLNEAMPCLRHTSNLHINLLRNQLDDLKETRNSAGDFGTILNCLCLESLYSDRLKHVSKRMAILSKVQRTMAD